MSDNINCEKNNIKASCPIDKTASIEEPFSEQDIREVWFIEQIKACFAGGKPLEYEEWKSQNPNFLFNLNN